MPILPRDILKKYFEHGDRPTQGQFAAMLDSMVNFADDRDLIGLRKYNTAVQYLPGDTVVYNDGLYECTAATSGAFNIANWKAIANFGAVVYAGTWNAINNIPLLQSGSGTKGFYYVVSAASTNPSDNKNLDGIDDWSISDWVIFNGSKWEKVDNSGGGGGGTGKAIDVEFTPNGDISSTNVQAAIVELRNDTDTKLAGKMSASTLVTGRYQYASGPGSLSAGLLINTKDAVLLASNKVFGTENGPVRFEFGAASDQFYLTTDNGIGNESGLQVAEVKANLFTPDGEVNLSQAQLDLRHYTHVFECAAYRAARRRCFPQLKSARNRVRHRRHRKRI
jgi:hypothetical protein